MANYVVPYLTRRGNVFWFRMAVPVRLLHRLGRREIKFSLRTTVPEVARARCRILAVEFLQLTANGIQMAELSQDIIARLARAVLAKQLDEIEDLTVHKIPDDPAVDREVELSSALEEAAKLQKSFLVRPFDQATTREAETALIGAGLSRKGAGMEGFEALCSAILRARIEALRIYAATLSGRFNEAVPKDPLFLSQSPVAHEKPDGPSVRELADRYFAFKSGREWVGKSETDNRRIIGSFMDLVGGDRPITSLSDADIREFRDALQILPSNFRKRKGMDRADIKSVLATASGKDAIGKATARKYFDNVQAFLKWCADEGYLEKVPGKSVHKFIVSRQEAELARSSFSPNQLRALFASPLYCGCYSAERRSKPGTRIYPDGKFWIPLIGLFSGLRLGEIVQLLVKDVREEEGVLFFDVARSAGEHKQIKTASSVRRVPVHHQLRTLGFDRLLAARKPNSDVRLFDDIAPGKDGYYSHNFSKWFGRYLRDVGLKAERTTFHSFRHCFKDALMQAGVPEAHAKELMGHADNSAHGLYGSKLPVKLLDESLQMIKYPIDWSALVERCEGA